VKTNNIYKLKSGGKNMKKVMFYFSMLFSIICLSLSLLNAQNINLYCSSMYNPDANPDHAKMLFMKLNPITASATVIDTLTPVKGISTGSTTYDHSCHHYIFEGGNELGSNSLFVLDTNGTILSDIPYINNVLGFQYDMKNQALYSLFIGSLSTFSLIIFNPDNGNITQVNTLNNVSSIGTVTFNSNTGKYIFVGDDNSSINRLYVINAQNGIIESSGALGVGDLSMLQYDNNANKLYGLYKNNNVNPYLFYFSEIDTLTAGITIIDSLDEISGVSSTSSVYDQATSSYIFSGGDTSGVERLYVINSITGKIISKSPIDVSVGEIECDNTKYALNKYHSTDVKNIIPTADNCLIYPNPVTAYLQIQTALQIKNVEITDITGKLLYATNAKTIDCNNFAKGVYFIRVTTEKGVAVKKFVKE